MILKYLTEISEKTALSEIASHKDGFWKEGGIGIGRDFLYGNKVIRLTILAGKKIWERGPVVY